MSDYSKTTNFTAKDSLTSGDPNKVIKGATYDTEFDAVEASSTTKANKVVSGTVNAVITQTASGDLADSGYSFSGMVGVTAVTKAEVDILDGATLSTDDLNILAGADAAGITATELQTLDGVTSDIQPQVDLKSPLASPAFTGSPTAPTQSSADNSTKLATTAYADASGGGAFLLSTTTASSSATIDMTGIDSTYDQYIVNITNYVPENDGTFIYMRVSNDAGSTFETSLNYAYAVRATSASTGADTNTTNGADSALVVSGSTGIGNGATEGVDLTIRIMNPSSTSKYVALTWEGIFVDSSGITVFFKGGGNFKTTSAVDAVRFLQNSGNISTGTFSLYGVKK